MQSINLVWFSLLSFSPSLLAPAQRQQTANNNGPSGNAEGQQTQQGQAQPGADSPDAQIGRLHNQVKSLEEQLKKKEDELVKMQDKALRALAEVENVRNRGIEEVKSTRLFAVQGLVCHF